MIVKQKLICIMGPTAVGKTKLSLELAKRFNGEIISGDSMQIYKGMDIGTAKIKKAEMEGIPHHMLDIREPSEAFNAAEFQRLVKECIEDITARGKLPIIVGGTGLYIEAVLQNYSFAESVSDPQYRSELEALAEEEGAEAVHRLLAEVDPESAEAIHPNNRRRVIRALEIYRCTGKKMSDHQMSEQKTYMYDAVLIGLTADRETLYTRINERVDQMVREGLVEEVKALYDSGLRGTQSIQAIGYKELYAYFDGKCSLEEAVDELKQNSRRYAKRQLTWFRNKMDLTWFEISPDNMEKKVQEISVFAAGKLGI